MVHHIVMWKFKPEIPEEKRPELKAAMKENLNALVGKVPGLLEMNFVDEPLSSSTHDIALVSVMEKARVLPYTDLIRSCGSGGYICTPYVTERACLDY